MQRPRPFAYHLGVDSVAPRTPNDSSKRVCLLVKWSIRELERVPQQSIGSPPYLVVHDNGKNGCQIIIHGVAGTACLKLAPGTVDLLKPSPQSSLWRVVSQFTVRVRLWARGQIVVVPTGT
jgi:hypothetical protein